MTAAMLLHLMLVSGCRPDVSVDYLQFTPDSTGVVFVSGKGSVCGWYGMGWILAVAAGQAELRWMEAPDRREIARFLLDRRIVTPLTPRPPLHVRTRMPYVLVSPDSQHVALLREEGRILIVARGGNRWTLPHARNVSRLAWMSPTEVAYVETREFQWRDDRLLTVWRQTIPDDSERRMVYGASRRRWQTYWSPTGQHTVIHVADGVKLLDVRSGDAVDLGLPVRADLRHVAWSPDGMQVFLLVWDKEQGRGPPYRLRFVVYQPRTGRRVEWAESHRRFPSVGGDTGPVRSSSWTAESRYLILESGEGRWLLLDPQSRHTGDLNTLLAEHFRREGIRKVYDVGGFPVPGWLWLETPAPSLEEAAIRLFAFDYQGRHFVKIAQGDEWAVSPDGKLVAWSDRQGQVHIRKLQLPALNAGAPDVSVARGGQRGGTREPCAGD